MQHRATTIILGGGISGLTAARTLQQRKRKFLLLERCPTLGGLTRTVEVGEFCFDYTGHFLHLSRYKTPADIPYANLKNHEWTQIERRSCCLVGGKLITAPIQYHLAELSPLLLSECVKSYNKRPPLPPGHDASFRDYIVSGFGQALADLFLIPQNEKTMAISLDRLSQNAVRRFFPPPDEKLVRLGMMPNGDHAAKGYNSTFWYPREGGIGRLVQGLRTGLRGCVVNSEVTSVNLRERSLLLNTGETLHWEQMFSSIPLNSLCRMTNDDQLIEALSGLSCSSTVSFNIGLHGRLPERFEGIHWIYVPDRAIPFYRVGFYSNIGTGTCTPGYSSLYVEVGLTNEEFHNPELIRELEPKVMRYLRDLDWLQGTEIASIVIHLIEHAYVHHTPQRDAAVEAIRARLRQAGIYPIGRYGLWDYTSMEDSMESARAAVLEVQSCNAA